LGGAAVRKRYLNRYDEAAIRIVPKVEEMARAVKSFQPFLSVRQSQTPVEQILGYPMFRKPGAVVSNLDTNEVI
jgi:hypothetical protein